MFMLISKALNHTRKQDAQILMYTLQMYTDTHQSNSVVISAGLVISHHNADNHGM